MVSINETHDPELTSWVDSANGDKQFPIQNLPFAIFRSQGDKVWRGGVAIGNKIIDLAKLREFNLFDEKVQNALDAASTSSLNALMGMGQDVNSDLRLSLSRALRTGSALQSAVEQCLIEQDIAEYAMPCDVGDYTDFYTSIHHATAVGKLFRPDNPLLPNYKWVPIGYHGRASSIGVSGQSFHRPIGQTKSPDSDVPELGPCQRLDYELELGIFVGAGTNLGQHIPISEAEAYIFGVCLLNDWSARDIQAWEYQPLGPFLAKNFATTISPWIVTLEALAPYRVPFERANTDPQPLSYLTSPHNSRSGGLNIELECFIETPKMRDEGRKPFLLSQSNFKYSYWTIAQLLTHHTVGGCSMRSGDLLGSGTQSGPKAEEAGSLLELTQGGKVSLTLQNGESRTFLQDGDAIIMQAYCQTNGAATIGFGEVKGTVKPAQ